MNKQAKFLTIALTVVLVSGLLISGCTTTPSEEEPIELIVSFGGPPVHHIVTDFYEPWAEAVEEETNGRVIMTIYTGGALGPDTENFDLVVSGGADIAGHNTGFTPGRFPLYSIIELPGFNPTMEIGNEILQTLYDEYPQFEEELEPTLPLCVLGQQPIIIHTCDKPVRTMEDLQGLTLRVNNETVGDMITALGGTPTFMGMMDLYTALERGTVDGAVYVYEADQSFGLWQVTKYTTEFPLSTVQGVTVMNQDTFDSLPSDVQELITTGDLGWDYITERSTYGMNLGQQEGYALVQAQVDAGKYEIIYLSDEEQARWMETLQPVFDNWVTEREADGDPGQEILDRAYELLDELTS